jgi:hypothetical protein
LGGRRFSDNAELTRHQALRRVVNNKMSSHPVVIRLNTSRRLLTALLVATTTILLAFFRTGLWKFDLSVPIQYWGDALYFEVIAKAVTDGGWGHYISRLGMPFGMDSVDFPTAMHLNLALMKVLSVGLRDPFLLINLFWLMTLGLGGAFAYLFLRWIGISNGTSACFGILYGLIPFGFYRNIGHLNVVYFMVPAGAYLGVSLARGEVFRFVRPRRAEGTDYRDLRRLVLTLGICAAMGFAYVYWPFFTCFVIFLGGMIGYARTRNLNVPLSVCLYVTVIVAAVVVNVSPTLLYWHRNGPNLEAQSKAPAQADEYALRIRQMLMPISTHPLRVMRNIREKILAAGFPFDRNESFTAALGTLGSLGFLLLLWAAIAPAGGTIFGHRTIRILAGMAIGVLVIATEGGFGSLFSVFISHEVRGYNRISPFISLFSFAALGVLLDRLLWRFASVPRIIPLGAILCLGVFDQIPLDILTGHEAAQTQFRKDRDYIRQLETKFPSGAMIFQLPHTNFPLDVAPNKMEPYDHSKAYLHSHALRWSWGNMMGRQENWARSTAQLPTDQFVKKIVFAGFDGILLDRNGFSDGKLEEELSKKLGASTAFDSGFRWISFDLRPFRKELEATLPAGEWEKQRQAAGMPSSTRIEWAGDFSVLETSKEGSWRWCGKTGIIRFVNYSDAAKVIDVSGQAFVFGGTYPLSIRRDGQRQQLQVSQEPAVYHDRFVLAAHSSSDISFEFDGPLLEVPSDPRRLGFQLRNFQWYDEDPSEAPTRQ